MKFSVDKKERYTTLAVQEESIDAQISASLKSEFVMMKNSGAPNLILDFEQVEFIDSSGLSALLTAHRLYQGNGAFVITNVKSDHVMSILKISRLDSVLEIVPSMQEAEDIILMGEIERELMAEEE